MDAGKHFIGGVVTQEFLQFSKDRGEFGVVFSNTRADQIRE